MNQPQAMSPSSWAEFYLVHRRALMAYGLSLTGSVADAQDLIQDVLLRVIARGCAPENAKAFVLRCMRNAAMDRRRAAASARVGMQRQANVLFDDAAADLATREMMTRVEAALNDLSEVQREVIVLKIYSEMTFAEIAEMLGAPMGTITSHYARGLAALRRSLESEVRHAR